ncbi:hypothetical protein DASB73_043140 [Starmerella bacillaris]|uniref:Uncharacterized protein n=1 Tax=Starmerella bacillaris TaxID=1247836 RepID=A0AAV5RRU1_STABA|nr:hypothetical protein DASB73_043140 [Starmerella bacillaris]
MKFRSYYSQHPLLTIALTNLLLMGLADSLAQTINSIGNSYDFEEDNNPFMKFVLDKGRMKQVWLDEAEDDLAMLGLADDYGDGTTIGPVQSFQRVSNCYLEFDFRRWAFFSWWGLSISALQSTWYAFLRSAYSEDAKIITIVQRVLADQLFYSPIMLACFLFYLGVIVERQPPSILHESFFWEKYIHTLSLNLSIWPLAQFVNFLLIPNALQIPFSSCISVLWNTYLSLNTQ